MTLATAVAALVVTVSLACSSPTKPVTAPRTYRMGFSHFAPRLTIPDVIATLDRWQPRGDAGILQATPPWKSLLADTSASFLIRREYLQIVQRYRTSGFSVVVMIDATDGLDRAREAPELLDAGRSISEPAIQAMYREFAIAIDTILHPDYLGLAMETNLVRAIAPPPVYAALRTVANSGGSSIAQPF